MESSFKPVIDSYASEIKSNVDRENPTQFTKLKKNTSDDQNSKIIDKMPNEISQTKKTEIRENSQKGDNFNKSNSSNSDNTKDTTNSPRNCINFQINGQTSSDFVKNKSSIKILNSLEKIEIRIPINNLFYDDKNDNLKLKKSTLNLQILAKIETSENNDNVKNETDLNVKLIDKIDTSLKKVSNEINSKECPKESLVKINDNLAKEISNKNNEKIRKRTIISRVIDKELEKQVKKITTSPSLTTTETKKNFSNMEAVKPETIKLNQEPWTIDKVTKTMDMVIDQKKLNDNVKEIDKKILAPTSSGSLKSKLKNPIEEEVASKKINEKYTVTKVSPGPLKIHYTAKSHTTDKKQRTINIDTKDRIDNKIIAKKEILKKRSEIKKDIVPKELKPLEKKKDGTLIDYGLNVVTRKNKDQPIKATIKEILTVKEKKINSPIDQLKTPYQLKKTEIFNHQKLESNQILSVATSELSTSPHEDLNEEKFIDFKMVLKLQDFDENHIFSGTSSKVYS